MDQWEQEWMLLQNQQQNNNSWAQDDAIDFGAPTYNSWAQDDAIDYGAPSFNYNQPSFDYTQPSFDYTQPSFDYTPAPQYNTATLQTNAPWWQAPTSFASMGYGAPISPNQSFGGATATMQAGSGPTNIGATTFAGPNTTVTAPAATNTGGRFGVTDDQNRNTQPALLESASVGLPGQEEQKQEGGSRGVRDWVRDPENRDTVRLGIQGLGALAGYQAQRDAGRLAKEQMGLQAQNMAAQREAYDREMAMRAEAQAMQKSAYEREIGLRAEAQAMQRAAYEREMGLREEALASQRGALQQNQQMAQRANQESIRSFDEARSLYNPQELGIRGMAQQRGATQRSIEDTRRTLASRGMSAAAIEAEVRRQRVAGATGESAAYMRGLDTGRSAQAGALTSAKALGATMPGLTYGVGPNAPSYVQGPGAPSYVQGPGAPTFAPNYSGAEFYSKQGADNSKALRDLLESYANYPTLRAQEEARRDMQRRSNT